MSVTYGAYDSTIEAKVTAFLRDHPGYQQFGQAHDDAVWGGATACTHTVWQAIIRMVKGRHYSLNEINSLAGMPYRPRGSNGQPRGMNNTEAQRLINRLNLPYKIVFGQPWSYLRLKAKLGPVMYGMRYGSAPEWRGYRYSGVTASSPYAIKGGKTQLVGFENGRHAVLLAAVRKAMVNGVSKNVAYRKEPNHGSPARPEKPAYDIILTTQASAEYNAYHTRLGATLYAAVPTKAITVHA